MAQERPANSPERVEDFDGVLIRNITARLAGNKYNDWRGFAEKIDGVKGRDNYENARDWWDEFKRSGGTTSQLCDIARDLRRMDIVNLIEEYYRYREGVGELHRSMLLFFN